MVEKIHVAYENLEYSSQQFELYFPIYKEWLDFFTMAYMITWKNKMTLTYLRFAIGSIFNIFNSISTKRYNPPSILGTIQVSLELIIAS